MFVDLALISAGEEPWAIDRVNCFHAAAIGYAPLIFMDKDKGCDHMLRQCRLVFTNVAADVSLLEKLASVLVLDRVIVELKEIIQAFMCGTDRMVQCLGGKMK